MKVVVFLVLFCSSCKIISTIFIGVQPPKIEDENSIRTFLQKERITVNKIYTVAPDSFQSTITYLSFLILIFNKEGSFITFGEKGSKYCFKTLPDSIAGLHKNSFNQTSEFAVIRRMNYTPGSNIPSVRYDTIPVNLSHLTNKFHDLNGNIIQYRLTDNKDYVAIIPFALYYGSKIQTKEIRRYIKSFQQNESSNFEIILLNLDKQQWWGSGQDQINFETK